MEIMTILLIGKEAGLNYLKMQKKRREMRKIIQKNINLSQQFHGHWLLQDNQHFELKIIICQILQDRHCLLKMRFLIKYYLFVTR